MALCMSDLVAKAQGLPGPGFVGKTQAKKYSEIMASSYNKYLYHNELKTLPELARIAGMHPSTLGSRFRRGIYRSVEEAVDTPLRPGQKT